LKRKQVSEKIQSIGALPRKGSEEGNPYELQARLLSQGAGGRQVQNSIKAK